MSDSSQTPPNSFQPGTGNAPHKKAVFIVEDDLFLVKAYQIKFTKDGVETWVASDGSEALEFLKKDAPAVVLLDLMLPYSSGFDVLKAIRETPAWKEVPVIVLTNLGQSQDVDKAKSLGANEYLVKANTKISDIAEMVKKYLA